MEPGYTKANSLNLPRIDAVMLGEFFASNKDFCAAEFRNIKTSMSSRSSYGDDALSYVQLKRDGKLCIVQCKICPEHRVHAKLYRATLTVDEEYERVLSVECHDCVASQGGCKHAIAFLMWVHRRSEEPSCTEVACYWKKSKLAKAGTTLKYLSAKDLSKGAPCLPPNNTLLEQFIAEGRIRNLRNCELLRYHNGYRCTETESQSMHRLVLQHAEPTADSFIEKLSITDELVAIIERETRDQTESHLWHELRYARVTASRAYEFSRCQTKDGSLVSLIMGGKVPETVAIKRGRLLEEKVKKEVAKTLRKKIRKCGLMISKDYPIIAGSPDGICEEHIIEIKCPISEKTSKNYFMENKPHMKYYTQMQVQMYLTNCKEGYFCVADWNFTASKAIKIVEVKYDPEFTLDMLKQLVSKWKQYIYPLLHTSTL